MLCKDLQTKLAAHDDLTPDERSHAEACPDCAAFATFDADLGSRLAHWRDAAPRSRRERARPRPFRLAYAGVGLAAALTLALAVLPARSTAQDAYRRMLGKIRQVSSVHLVVRWRKGQGRPEDDPLRKVYELEWRPGAWREKWEGLRPSVKREGLNGIEFFRFEPSQAKVVKMQESAEQPDFRNFDLAKFAAQYMDAPTRFEQPTPTRLIALNAAGWSRMIFTLDADGLPTHAEKQRRSGQSWETSGEIDLEFDRPIPEERFAPESLDENPRP